MSLWKRWFGRARREGPPPVPGSPMIGRPEEGKPFVLVPIGETLMVLDRMAFEYRAGLAPGTDPDPVELDAALARADRVRALAGGMYRDEAVGCVVLLETNDPGEIDELRRLLAIDPDPSRFGHCACLGGPTLEFFSGDETVATIGLHHGRSIRWYRWKHDAPTADPEGLRRWLAGRGIEVDFGPPAEDPTALNLLAMAPAERLARRGESYRVAGDLARALGECRRALELEPGSPPALGVRGLIYRDSGRLAEADLGAAIAGGFAPPAVRHARAVVRDQLGRPDEAIADCDELIRADPSYAPAYQCRALIRARLGRVDAARLDYDEAVRLAPDWPLARWGRGLLLLHGDDPERAEADFAALVDRFEADDEAGMAPPGPLDPAEARASGRPAIGPDLPGALVMRARCRLGRGDLDGAAADLARAAEVEPENPAHRLALGDLHLRRGAADEAVDAFDGLVRLDPTDPGRYLHRARAQLAAGRAEEALEDADQALWLAPEDPSAVDLRGLALLELGRPLEAAEEFSRALELAPGAPPLLLRRSEARRRLGDHAGRREDLETLVRQFPNDPLSCNNLAWMLATCPEDDHRDGPRALDLARRAAELTEYRSSSVLDTLAACYAECGRFDDALRWQRRALELDPEQSPHLLDDHRDRLALYERRSPFRAD